MKSPLQSARLFVKTGVLSMATLMAIAIGACTSEKKQVHELPSGRFLQPEVPSTPAQSRSLSEEIEHELSQSLDSLFHESIESKESHGFSTQELNVISKALAKSFSKGMTVRIGNSSSSNCVAISEKMVSYLSCLFYEVVEENFKSTSDAQRWVSSLSVVDKKSGQAVLTEAEVKTINSSAATALVGLFSRVEWVNGVLVKLGRSMDSALRALEILASQQVSMDLPYIGESFIEGKRYVLTTSLQQGSVGSSRVFNLDSMIVELKINNKRLVITQVGDGLYSGSSQEDIIVGSYPIVRIVEDFQSKENYYQVDFSRPENKSFLVVPFGANSDPSLQMSADVVVPKVVHAAKEPLAGMTNGLYFNGKDNSFVLDQLVLLNSTAPLFGDDDDAIEDSSAKDSIRPTVHVVQGLFPVQTGKDSFAEKQAIPMTAAQLELRSRGVKDLTEGRDVPYFATSALFEERGGRAREAVTYVRKFDLNKDITFVVSRSVPAQVVPVIKSAVQSYAEVFKSMTPEGVQAPKITALTQDEFEAANRVSGLGFGGSVTAADPRVSMIYWDDSFSIGSAWATAAANPSTGEIISGDVMLTGSMWAMEGCKSYFAKTWQKSQEPNLPNRPAGTVPSPISRFLWDAKCDAALANLGILSKRSTNPVQPTPASLKAFDEANRKGDLVALAAFASELLQRRVKPEEMVSETSVVQDATAAREQAEHFVGAIRESLGLKGDVKKIAEHRAAELESKLSGAELNSSNRRLKRGKNVLVSRLDCVKEFIPNASLDFAESGSPAITSPLVNSPEAGALSLVRSVVVHELGHVFGLRHNFIASTTPAVFADDAVLPVAIDSHSDSVMDYNDYGIDMGSGAMKDYTSPEGAVGHPTFGAYDVVALGAAYQLPTLGMKFKNQTAFCTDRNVGLLGNCQRFDYGKDFNEFTLHRANLMLQRLKYANPLDAILDPRAPMAYAQLLRSLSQEITKLTTLWGLSQTTASESIDYATRTTRLQLAELGYRGVGAQQEFLKNFSKIYGMEPLGVKAFLSIQPSFFASPEFGALISEMLRKDTSINVMAITRALQNRARSLGSDSSYTGVVHNLSHAGTNYAYLDELIDGFAQQVVLSKGTAVNFDYLDDGQRKDGSTATLDGKPFVLNLQAPFFNHRAQVIAIPNVSIDGPAPGSRKSVTMIVQGKKSIDDMLTAISALGVLAGENPEHPVLIRLIQQAEALNALLNGEPCATTSADDASVAVCEALKPEVRAPAAIILNSILSATQGALPKTTVASGESAF